MHRLILELVTLVIKDVKEWFEGPESAYDYSEFVKKAGGKFKSEILLEQEKNRLKNKPT